ncbi:MAG: thiamine pyrophosphate-requiring protein [Rhodospirillales bacterium]|nr:thiamine pyrophosphate-requiring protein [Rhodospirillales bacterium]
MKDGLPEDLSLAETEVNDPTVSAGAALLSRLKTLGVDYIFANSGTDFPPVIEGLAEAAAKKMKLPHTVITPHETASTAMAHGYYLATRKAQAVMVHTNVGLANAVIGVINARADNIPMLVFSGRTPTTEKDRFGSRTVPIGWGQEMADQTALVREACKWDYELRFPEQIYDVVDRGHAIAHSTPSGPVYMSLPREVLCERVPAAGAERRPQMQAAKTAPPPDDLKRAAKLLAEAKNPVIFAQRGTGSQQGFEALSRLAEEWAIPVCQYWAVQLAVPTGHPMHSSPAPGPLLATADVILVIDSLAPWSPDVKEPKEDCTVIQLALDPLFSQTPIRNFRSDISLPGEITPSLLALKAEMDKLLAAHAPRNASRKKAITSQNAIGRGSRRAKVEIEQNGAYLTKPSVSALLSKALETHDSSVFAELGCQMPFMDLTRADSWFESPHSGGLGWGFPAAMGFKLARPEKTVVATVGDGSYIFSNPVACHQIAEAMNISIIVIILNNSEWGAVRQSVLDLYPDGYAAKANSVPLTEISPSPDFTLVAQASRAWARSVKTVQQLEDALQGALAHTLSNKGLALIEVAVARN